MECVMVYMCWVFVFVFSLFLNNNIFSIDMLLVEIYGVEFYSFY
jgi:hypothetical protein